MNITVYMQDHPNEMAHVLLFVYTSTNVDAFMKSK